MDKCHVNFWRKWYDQNIKIDKDTTNLYLQMTNLYLQMIGYSLSKLTLDWLIFAKIFVIFVRFRGVLRPWSRFYREYEDIVNSLMLKVW